jgi:hypothetical protein
VRIKRGLVLATAVAALSVSLSAGSAQATTGNGSSTCALSGQASTSPPVQLQGGSGTYSFSSFTADCVVQDASDGTVVADVKLNSAGNYTNTVCGTGNATDADASATLTQTVPAGKLGDEFPVTGIGYSIDFTSGNGTLDITSSGTNSAGHSFDTTQSSGQIQILPAPSAHVPAVGECTNGFAVAGTLSLVY